MSLTTKPKPFVCTEEQKTKAERHSIYIDTNMPIEKVLELFEDIMDLSHKHYDRRFVLDFWFPIFFDETMRSSLTEELKIRWDAVANWIVNLQREERRYKTTYTL